MQYAGQASRRGARSASSSASSSTTGMEHLNLSLPLHVQVPPLPSPNTTAAAAALFRVNQLPSTAMSPPGLAVHGDAQHFTFKPSLKKRQRMHDALSLGIYAPHTPTGAPAQPTPTTAAAAAAAMALSASAPATASSMEQYEQNKRAMLMEAAAASSAPPTDGGDTAAVGAGEGEHDHGDGGRRRKVGIPKFLRYLFQMLEFEDSAVIAWSHDGSAFQIRDPDELAERVLPKYFKHNKVSSFQRQLNYFGFKKWTKTQTNICTFSHPFFHREEQDKMRLIKRKERSTRQGKDDACKTGAGGRKQHGHGEEGDGHDHDESDEPTARPPPAKRAKAGAAPSQHHPQQQSHHHSMSDQQSATNDTKRPATASLSGHSRPPAKKKEPKATVKATAKPPRAKKSPRGGGRGGGSDEQQQQPETMRDAARDRPVSSSSSSAASSGGRSKKMQLPTISPASAASTSTSSGVGGGSSLGRLLPHSASPSPTSQAAMNAMYGRTSSSNADADAAPVMPVHSELMMQQQQHHNNAFLRRFQNGPYDNGMADLSEAFSASHGGWPSQQTADSVAYGLAPFKFQDTGAAFDMGGGAVYAGGAANGVANAKDYLDVLLESANMDDQISAASANGPTDAGMAWESPYQQQQQQQHAAYDQTSREQAMATFNMLQSQSQNHGNGMLPSIEDLQGAGRY